MLSVHLLVHCFSFHQLLTETELVVGYYPVMVTAVLLIELEELLLIRTEHDLLPLSSLIGLPAVNSQTVMRVCRFPFSVIFLHQFVAFLRPSLELTRICRITKIRSGIVLRLVTPLFNYRSGIIRMHREILSCQFVIMRNIALSDFVMQHLLGKPFISFMVLAMNCKTVTLVESMTVFM